MCAFVSTCTSDDSKARKHCLSDQLFAMSDINLWKEKPSWYTECIHLKPCCNMKERSWPAQWSRKCERTAFIGTNVTVSPWVTREFHAMPLSWLAHLANTEIEAGVVSPESSRGDSFEQVENDGSIPRSIPLLVWLISSRTNIRTLAILMEGEEVTLNDSVAVRSVLADPGWTTTLILFSAFDDPLLTCTTGLAFCTNECKQDNGSVYTVHN